MFNNIYFDCIGTFNFLIGSIFGVFKFVANIDFNLFTNILTTFSLLIGTFYISMKIYDQYLITKKRKKDLK